MKGPVDYGQNVCASKLCIVHFKSSSLHSDGIQ